MGEGQGIQGEWLKSAQLMVTQSMNIITSFTDINYFLLTSPGLVTPQGIVADTTLPLMEVRHGRLAGPPQCWVNTESCSR